MRQRLWMLILYLGLIGSTGAAVGEVVVFQVVSRPATTLVQAVRPLLGGHGSVSAYHDKLIVQGTPAEIAAVRELLRDLDRPARRLIIEVRQAGSLSQSTQRFGYGVNTGEVRLGRAPSRREAWTGFQQLETRGRGDSLQRVQALDGRPALIRSGRSMPVYQTHQYLGPYGIAQGYEMHYRDTQSGFFALPRVHGDQVTVEIFQQHERAALDGGFDRQRAATVLRGGLGQWLTLGSVGDADADSSAGIGRHVQTRRAQDRQLELRVIAVD